MQQWFSKFIRGRLFSVLFCILGLSLIGYLSTRLGALVEAFTALDLRIWIFVVQLIFFTYMLAYFHSRKPEKKSWKLFELCSVLFCFFPSIAICFLVFDGAALVFELGDDRLYLIPLLLAFFVTGYGFLHARRLRVKEYHIRLAAVGAAKQVKLVLLSDIHAGNYVDRRQLHRIVSAANQVNADLVIMAGDTFDQDAFWRCDLAAVRDELRALRPKGRVYAVLGNHDPDSSHGEVREFFREAGVGLLVDECAETEDFIVIGRDDILGNPNRKTLDEMIRGAVSPKPKLVIDHNPVGIDEAAAEHVELILCGHTHKGQFFPATLFTKLAYGARGFYGHCKTGHTHSIVSAGAGYFQLPVRFGTNSEVAVIHVELGK